MNRLKGLTITFLWYLVISSVNFQFAECAKKSSSSPPPSQQSSNHVEPVIEEVNAKQLERILLDKDYVAVFWCKCQKWWKKNFFRSRREKKGRMIEKKNLELQINRKKRRINCEIDHIKVVDFKKEEEARKKCYKTKWKVYF